MKPSEKAKAAGLRSLKQASEMTSTSEQTLINWSRSRPELFDIILTGCKNKLKALEQ